MDQFEKHICDIREKLDTHEPGPGVWKRIEKSVPHMASPRPQRMIPRAAVILLLAGAGALLAAVMLQISARANDPGLAMMRDTQRYYDNKIRLLHEEAAPLLTDNPEIRRVIALEMDELDSLSALIMKDLNESIAGSEVIEALINNYRLRIELLEDMLQLMRENGESLNNPKKEYQNNEL